MVAEKARIEKGKVDAEAMQFLTDYVRVVGDELHHGKEETILFPALRGRSRSYEFDDITSTLMKEHATLRTLLRTLETAVKWHREGDTEAHLTYSKVLGEMTEHYQRHIKKEDCPFFQSAMSVLTQEEKDAMLLKMEEFDRTFMIRHYDKRIEGVSAELLLPASNSKPRTFP